MPILSRRSWAILTTLEQFLPGCMRPGLVVVVVANYVIGHSDFFKEIEKEDFELETYTIHRTIRAVQ